MKKRLKVLGVALAIAALLVLTLGSTVFADAPGGTEEYTEDCYHGQDGHEDCDYDMTGAGMGHDMMHGWGTGTGTGHGMMNGQGMGTGAGYGMMQGRGMGFN